MISFKTFLTEIKSVKDFNPRDVYDMSGYNDDSEWTEEHVKSMSHLDLRKRNLSSLDGLITEECETLWVDNNKLTSFEGFPSVSSELHIPGNRFTSLKGLQNVIGFSCKELDAAENNITTLEDMCSGHPDDVRMGWFDISHNALTSFKGVASCKKITADYNAITDLPQCLGLTQLSMTHNKLESLSGIHKCIPNAKNLDFSGNPIKEAILGLALLSSELTDLRMDFAHAFLSAYEPPPTVPESEYLTEVAGGQLLRGLVERYMGSGKEGLLNFQKALIDNHLPRLAKL